MTDSVTPCSLAGIAKSSDLPALVFYLLVIVMTNSFTCLSAISVDIYRNIQLQPLGGFRKKKKRYGPLHNHDRPV